MKFDSCSFCLGGLAASALNFLTVLVVANLGKLKSEEKTSCTDGGSFAETYADNEPSGAGESVFDSVDWSGGGE